MLTKVKFLIGVICHFSVHTDYGANYKLPPREVCRNHRLNSLECDKLRTLNSTGELNAQLSKVIWEYSKVTKKLITDWQLEFKEESPVSIP